VGANEAENPVSHLLKRMESAKMFGSAVLSQALLSAANFGVGLLLIRHTSDLQYGYYILAWSAVVLALALHNAFVNPVMVNQLTSRPGSERGDIVGGIFRDQTNALMFGAVVVFVSALALWYAGVFESHTGPLVLVTIGTAFATLQRNFFRMVLLAHRRPYDVLAMDILYVLLLALGTVIAIQTLVPDTITLVVMGLAAVGSGFLAARFMWRHQPWNVQGARGILRALAPMAALSTAGAGIHWAFSQGYMYLAAGMLDVAAVAAIAATRLLMMPINLLSTGIGGLMLPLTAEWLQRRGASFAMRRLGLFAAGMACVTICYVAVLWLTRDWIFTVVLKKHFEHRDQLLLLWALCFLPMTIRDQFIYLPVVSQRFRQLTVIGLIGALVSLFAGYIGMRKFGVVGAPLGVLVGESLSLCGVLFLSLRVTQGAAFNRTQVAAEVS
jgi:O-antigen/teichoic acid export membrane protein